MFALLLNNFVPVIYGVLFDLGHNGLTFPNGICLYWPDKMNGRNFRFRSFRLFAELIVLFVGLPGALLAVRHRVHGLIIPLILVAGLVCWLWLRRQPDFDRSRLWNTRDFRRHLGRTLAVFLPLGAVAAGFSYWLMPDSFLMFPRWTPGFWLIVMVCYPVFSAYPQELIYRAFFFHRYGRLLGERGAWIVSALLFGWAHVFLGNWVAPVGAALGGLLFGRTYQRSGSLLQAALEHGLWGDLLFTVGVGFLFYAGSIG